jgi:hypothetical protein
MTTSISVARALAADHLATLPERWAHTQAVARHAEEIAPVVGPHDYDLFLCAAWVLDIGYGPKARRTGWHRLDGALFLVEHGWPARIGALVAYHCEGDVIASARGLTDQLARFARQDGVVADALVYADLMSGPAGARISMKQRMEELERPQPDEVRELAEARAARRRPLLEAAARTEHRLRAVGHSHAIR